MKKKLDNLLVIVFIILVIIIGILFVVNSINHPEMMQIHKSTSDTTESFSDMLFWHIVLES
jgi:uncharacterized membrane protein